jgi:hypothetical protein
MLLIPESASVELQIIPFYFSLHILGFILLIGYTGEITGRCEKAANAST